MKRRDITNESLSYRAEAVPTIRGKSRANCEKKLEFHSVDCFPRLAESLSDNASENRWHEVFDLSVALDVDTAADVDVCRGKLVDINVPANESLAFLLAH